MHGEYLEKSYIPFQCLIISALNRFSVGGVSTAQYQVLDALASCESKTTKQLAVLRGISQSGASKLTKRLLDKKYIEQRRNEHDRRSHHISITPEGRDFLERAEKFRNEILVRIGDALSPEEIKMFSDLCRKITGVEDVCCKVQNQRGTDR